MSCLESAYDRKGATEGAKRQPTPNHRRALSYPGRGLPRSGRGGEGCNANCRDVKCSSVIATLNTSCVHLRAVATPARYMPGEPLSRTGGFGGLDSFAGLSVGRQYSRGCLPLRASRGGKIGRMSRRRPLTPYTHFIGSLWITVAVLGIWVAAFEDCHESSKAASFVCMATFGSLCSEVP